MPRQRVAGCRTGPGDDVEHALRQSGLQGNSPQFDRGQRRVAGRLEDRGISGGQRRRHFPGCDRQREIPRNDQRHHADRLAQREVETGSRDRDGLAEDPGGRPRVVLEALRGPQHLIARIADGLTGIARFELRQALGVRPDELGNLVEHLRPRAGGGVAPAASLERLPCRLYRGIDVGRRRKGRLRHQVGRGRLHDVEGLIPLSGAPGSADQ